MRVIPVLVVACVVSQSALAQGLECHRVADPTPRLSCVEKPATAEAPAVQRPDAWTPPDTGRRDSGLSHDDNGGARNSRSCRNC
jgi:hypothetical protein